MAAQQVSEIWRPVVGFEAYYSVSSLGRIRRDAPSRTSKAAHVHAPRTGNRGYQMARLMCAGVGYQRQLHRLIAEAFHGPANGRHVNHINGIKTDNRAENLEWVTPAENVAHARNVLGLRLGGRLRLTASDVREIRQRAEAGETRRALAEAFGVCNSAITDVVTRKSWQHVH